MRMGNGENGEIVFNRLDYEHDAKLVSAFARGAITLISSSRTDIGKTFGVEVLSLAKASQDAFSEFFRETFERAEFVESYEGTAGPNRRWTNIDEKVLQEGLARCDGLRVIAKRLNRTFHAVRSKVAALRGSGG